MSCGPATGTPTTSRKIDAWQGSSVESGGLGGAADAESVEGDGAHGAGEVAPVVAVRPVPLGERVHHAEQEPRGNAGIHVGPDVAFGLGLADQIGDDPVKLAPPFQG